MRIAIIGGGISGLSAAYYLEQERAAGAPVEYSLFESNSRLGGVMFSDKIGDCVVEGGPDSFLTEKPWAAQLCAELGIAGDLIGSNDSQRITYIVVKGRLVPMPDGLMFMVPTKVIPTALTSLFSWGTKFKMLGELMHPPQPVHKDETVAQMVERHFGSEVVDRLADPLLSGVYGGDAASLSVRAVLPRFVEMEEKYGSLCRAMLAGRKKLAAIQKEKGYAPKPLFSSLKGGMQQMIDAIVARLNPQSLRTSTAVSQLSRKNGGWELITGRGPECFDAVIFATPARIASNDAGHGGRSTLRRPGAGSVQLLDHGDSWLSARRFEIVPAGIWLSGSSQRRDTDAGDNVRAYEVSLPRAGQQGAGALLSWRRRGPRGA